MIKRLIFSLTFIITLMLPANADNIMPKKVADINSASIGLYQIPLKIVIYKKPYKNSDVIYRVNWDYKSFNASDDKPADNFFTVLIQEKELAYVQVSDYTDDWAEIIYDKENNKKGWVHIEDLRFMTWRTFFNMYGRKYGLYYLANSPAESKKLHTSTEENSQIIEKIEKPIKIKLTVIKGNYALITAIENNIGKTGYVNWRNDNGEIYIFPAIK